MCWIPPEVQSSYQVVSIWLLSFLSCAAKSLVERLPQHLWLRLQHCRRAALQNRRGSTRSGSAELTLIRGEFGPWGTALVCFFNRYLYFPSLYFRKENMSRLQPTDSFQQGAAFIHLWSRKDSSLKGSGTWSWNAVRKKCLQMGGQAAEWGLGRGGGGQVTQLALGFSRPLHRCDASVSMAWYLGLEQLDAQGQCQQMRWIKTFPFRETFSSKSSQCSPRFRIITSGTGNPDLSSH